MHKRAFLLMLLGFIGLLFITTFSVLNLIKHYLSFSYSNVDKTQIEQAGLWNNKSKASEVTLIAALDDNYMLDPLDLRNPNNIINGTMSHSNDMTDPLNLNNPNNIINGTNSPIYNNSINNFNNPLNTGINGINGF
ncbi:MAG: hypothetical protein PUB79_01590 [Succinivibrio sp.]|nr:hypothetical protein [Succinivibrio sp.]